jgi:hypothetical protein
LFAWSVWQSKRKAPELADMKTKGAVAPVGGSD